MGVSPKWTRALTRSNSDGSVEAGESGQPPRQEQRLQRQRRSEGQQQEQPQRRLQCPSSSSSGVAAVLAEQPSSWWLDVEASALAAATTSVAVMAPALTEGGPQKPENLLPALPASGFLTAEQAKQVCQNREVLQFVVSANVQPSKIDEQCLHGIPKDLIDDVINLKFVSGFDGLSNLIAAGAPRKESAVVAREATNGGSAAIMNNPSMGDDEPVDNMCFFRTNMGPSGEQDELCEIDDIARDAAGVAQVADDDDDVAATVNDNTVTDEDSQIADDIMGFTDININVQADDLLQGLIQMNNTSIQEMLSGDSRLIDGCGGLMENVIPSQSTSDGVPEIFSENDAFSLLNEVDVMGLMGSDAIAGSGVVVGQHHNRQQQMLLQQHQLIQQEAAKLADLERHKAQIERRHHELERKNAFLTRRLRKFQSQLVGLHAAEEAGQVLEFAQKSAKKYLHQDLASLGPRGGNNARNFPELVGSITSFLQKVQKSCNAQSNSVAVRNRNSCRYFGAGSRDNYVNSNMNRMPAFGVPQIRIDGKQVEEVAGPLSTKLKILQKTYDSDCTASSSGGESCDEMQTFNNPHKQQLPISKRASWRWAQERANVAARWTWLQAQISDLEFRIRQHTDLQRQMRSTKGLVMLEVPATTITTSTSALGTGSYGAESTLNGYSGVLPSATAAATSRACGLEAGVEPAAANLGSSRCRPYVRHMFRKRKLVQLEGLHLHSKKAARTSNIRCDCDGRLAYCALCTGRRDPTAGQDMELMSVQERLALVDPGFHSVLSMPDEVGLSAHADAILRIPEWQQRMVRGGVRVSKIKDKDGNERRTKRASDHRSKCPSRLKKSQTTLLSTSIKRKLLKGKRSRNNAERPNNSNVNRKRPTKATQQQQHQLQQSQSQPQPQSQQLQSQSSLQQPQQPALPLDEGGEVASALSNSSKYSSPVPSPLLQRRTGGSATAAATPTSGVTNPVEKSTLKEKSFNSHSYSRLRQNSYDIDNIVIPYSIAAATRLEKLPYKDIVIPKWRICNVSPLVDVKNGAVQKSLPDSDVEDISENTIAQRHERSERDEAKRFMNFTHLPYQSRMRRDRRMEGRSESGANTPDPMSPHASECGGDTMSPITSPPPTPGNLHDSDHLDSHSRSGSLQNALRRKMPTRSQKEETTCPLNEEELEQQVLPYEPRNFPLTDEDFSEMRKEMPYEHPLESSSASDYQQNENKDDTELYCQESDSTESAVCDNEGDDPNDPEWSIEEREKENERMRPR